MISEDIHALAARAIDEVAAAQQRADLDATRARWLGRGDGLLTVHRKQLGKVVDPVARKQLGQTINALCERVAEAIEERRVTLERAEAVAAVDAERLDLTWPPPQLRRGHLHPTTRMRREMVRILGQLGYSVAEGPEVEYDLYNFTLVNMPPGHPARDTQDTFFVDDTRLLRTHTSPVQIRALVERGAPIKVIVPGRTYRRDYDATHFPMFHQIEGLCVDEDISVSDLKGTLEYFARSLFGRDRRIRLRPHHFPFTEPSLEVDVSCHICGGTGCRICRQSGWIELLGSGMVHPAVLTHAGVDPRRYSGFAFGIGIERAAQLRYNVDDGRLLYENDLRYLRQAW